VKAECKLGFWHRFLHQSGSFCARSEPKLSAARRAERRHTVSVAVRSLSGRKQTTFVGCLALFVGQLVAQIQFKCQRKAQTKLAQQWQTFCLSSQSLALSSSLPLSPPKKRPHTKQLDLCRAEQTAVILNRRLDSPTAAHKADTLRLSGRTGRGRSVRSRRTLGWAWNNASLCCRRGEKNGCFAPLVACFSVSLCGRPLGLAAE